MRAWPILSLIVLLPAGTGCSLFKIASHNVFWASVEEADVKATRRENERLARAALRQFEQANSDRSFSAAFARGFKEGYMTYLESGERDLLPAVPPGRDPRPAYALRRNCSALADWSDGFFVGASMARATGPRRCRVPPAACAAGPALLPGAVDGLVLFAPAPEPGTLP